MKGIVMRTKLFRCRRWLALRVLRLAVWLDPAVIPRKGAAGRPSIQVPPVPSVPGLCGVE